MVGQNRHSQSGSHAAEALRAIEEESRAYTTPVLEERNNILRLATYGNSAGCIAVLSIFGALLNSPAPDKVPEQVFWVFVVFFTGLACRLFHNIALYFQYEALMWHRLGRIGERMEGLITLNMYRLQVLLVWVASLAVCVGAVTGLRLFYQLAHASPA